MLQTAEPFRLLVEGIRDYAIFMLDARGHVASWNIGAERIMGYKSQDILGKDFSCFYPEEDIKTGKPQKELQLVATAGQCEDEGWRVRKFGERFWANMTISAVKSVSEPEGKLIGFCAIAHDLSDRKQIEEELCSLNRALTTICNCHQAIVRADSESELLQNICRIVVETGGYSLAWVGFAEPEEICSSVVPTCGYAKERGLCDRPGKGTKCISLPLIGDGQTLGVLRICEAESNDFDATSVQLLKELADDLAYGIVALRNKAERKAAEAALRESEERYRQLVELSPEAIVVHREGQIEFINTAGVKLLGAANQEQLIGRQVMDFVAPEERAIARSSDRGAIAQTERMAAIFREQKLLRLDGTAVAVESAETPLGYQRSPAVLTVARDITERQQMETALRESEELHRITLSNISEAVFITDSTGTPIYICPNVSLIFAYTLEEVRNFSNISQILGENLFDPDALETYGEIHNIERKIIDKNGSAHTLLVTVKRVTINGGTVLYTCRDITARKQAEEELKQYRDRLEELVLERTSELTKANEQLQQEISDRLRAREALIRVTQAVESTSDAVVIADINGRSIYHNPAFLELFEYTVDELNNAGGPTILFADTAVGNAVLDTIKQGNSWSGEVQMCKKSDRAIQNKHQPPPLHPLPNPLFSAPSAPLRFPNSLPTFPIFLRSDAVKDHNNQLVGLICVHTDITLIKQAEAEKTRLIASLQASEEQLRTLINAMPDIVCFKDGDGRWLEANDSIRQVFQLEGTDYRGKKDSELCGIDSPYRAASIACEHTDDEAWRKGTSTHGEEVISSYDRPARIFDIIKVPLFHPDGRRKGIVVLGRDISDRKQAEEELMRLASIVESSDDAIISYTFDGIILSWNAGAQRIYGYTAEEVKDRSIFILPLPVRAREVPRLLERIQQGASIDHYETVHLRKDGHQIYVSLTISPIKDAAGQITGVSTIARDITDLKRVEEALDRLRHQNELILNSAGEGICGLDRQGRTTFVNPAAAKMLGYHMGELLGVNIATILGDRSANLSRRHSGHANERVQMTNDLTQKYPIYAALKEGSVHHSTNEVFWRKDGSSFPVEYMSTPIHEQSEIVGAVVTFKDITDRLAIERMKDEFISVVSHELRTPLTSIRGSLGLLAGGLLNAEPAKAQRMLDIAVSNTDRLVRLINDILDLERISSGLVTIVKQTCNAADLMVQASDAMRPMAEKAGVTLDVTPVDAQVWVDPDRIIQTLTNLLSNAIKFSPLGTTVRLTGYAHGEQFLLQVKDRGRGIPADKLESIFERFQQVDASDSRKKGGTGLGLAICRSIVQQHGGRIWAESSPPLGSCFNFTVPRVSHRESGVPCPESGV